jgi:hypothetical protein
MKYEWKAVDEATREALSEGASKTVQLSSFQRCLTTERLVKRESRTLANIGHQSHWIPAFAGMTSKN